MCSDELASAFAKLEALTDSAAPISGRASELLSRLKGIRQHLEAAQRERAAPEDLKPLQEELDAIDAERLAHGGVFAGDVKGGHIPPGQAGAQPNAPRCACWFPFSACVHHNGHRLTLAYAALRCAVLSETLAQCYRARPGARARVRREKLALTSAFASLPRWLQALCSPFCSAASSERTAARRSK